MRPKKTNIPIIKQANEELKQATFLLLSPDEVDLHGEGVDVRFKNLINNLGFNVVLWQIFDMKKYIINIPFHFNETKTTWGTKAFDFSFQKHNLLYSTVFFVL